MGLLERSKDAISHSKLGRYIGIGGVPTIESMIKDIERTKKANMLKVIRYWRSRIPCTDCKHTYNWKVMTFDHLDRASKKYGVMELTNGGSKSQVIREIRKCELVCLNCHKLREYKRDYEPMAYSQLIKRIGTGIKI